MVDSTMAKIFDIRVTESLDTSTDMYHNDVLAACKNGDLEKLNHMLDDQKHIQATDTDDMDITIRPNLPTPSNMLYAAVAHHQSAVVKLLLAMYPNEIIATDALLGACFANPDLATLKVLHAHDNSIVNLNMFQHDGLDYLLLDYCRNGDPQLVFFLLDNGADPNIGGPPLPNWRPLPIAIAAHQPSSLIRKLIQCGAEVTIQEVEIGIRVEEVEVLELLLSECHWMKGARGPTKNMREALTHAHATNNQEVINLVHRRVKNERRKQWWRFWNWSSSRLRMPKERIE